jgi:hypothetical protein
MLFLRNPQNVILPRIYDCLINKTVLDGNNCDKPGKLVNGYSTNTVRAPI